MRAISPDKSGKPLLFISRELMVRLCHLRDLRSLGSFQGARPPDGLEPENWWSLSGSNR